MKPAFEVVVVGGGVVGLACAAALSRAGRRTLLLERREGWARETSSRNSQVIHAGLYYPPGSLKAELCVEGRERLYARLARLRLPHRAVGKLVVATAADEIPALEALLERGRANGAPDLALLDAQRVRALEPAVEACLALHSPRSGILDAHALADSYVAEAEAHGATLLLRRELSGIERTQAGFQLSVREPDGARARVECGALVNAAGLAADRVAALAGLDPDAAGLRLHYCKGDYFALAPGAPLRLTRLIYPLPGAAGLGIHVTPDLGGRLRLGPDTEWVDAPRYEVSPAKAERFAAAARRYLPGLESRWLSPDQAGVRPRLAGPGEGFRDFVVREESAAGLPGFVDLVGIESPGLTAAPAIAERVVALVKSA